MVVVACVVMVVVPPVAVGATPSTADTRLLAEDSAALIRLAGTLCLSAAHTSATTSTNWASMVSMTLLAVEALASPLLKRQNWATQDTTSPRKAVWADAAQTQPVSRAPQPLWLTQRPRQPEKATLVDEAEASGDRDVTAAARANARWRAVV
ncbi:uncharacterized protein SPSK_09977 [Sporothrix schenckii 1099-18]|uniref:Secreted protein n=1 Tax=Sporothrix schenckii 1099-18 TaxID=1397361 RepID=A0A0F2M6F4_SPOSC|nr:uncharacterized protein SPSK_09977 [Sporothrix schenckii 1099-18]KJR85273.1 hypothetical protein SPSK_09977 [Sporothrix schenckii 1099-18]